MTIETDVVIIGAGPCGPLKVHLQCTTTSPVMHERLGVEDPYAEDGAEAA